jgi:hypothetical protein
VNVRKALGLFDGYHPQVQTVAEFLHCDRDVSIFANALNIFQRKDDVTAAFRDQRGSDDMPIVADQLGGFVIRVENVSAHFSMLRWM